MNNQLKKSEFLLYQSDNNDIKIEVGLQDETVWLTQKQMGELFGVDKRTISYHLKEIYKSEELSVLRTVQKIRTVRTEGLK